MKPIGERKVKSRHVPNRVRAFQQMRTEPSFRHRTPILRHLVLPCYRSSSAHLNGRWKEQGGTLDKNFKFNIRLRCIYFWILLTYPWNCTTIDLFVHYQKEILYWKFLHRAPHRSHIGTVAFHECMRLGDPDSPNFLFAICCVLLVRVLVYHTAGLGVESHRCWRKWPDLVKPMLTPTVGNQLVPKIARRISPFTTENTSAKLNDEDSASTVKCGHTWNYTAT